MSKDSRLGAELEICANFKSKVKRMDQFLRLMLGCFLAFRPQDGFSALLRRHGGSRRNSLLRWSQSRTKGYKVSLSTLCFMTYRNLVKIPQNHVFVFLFIFLLFLLFWNRILKSPISAPAGRTVWRSVLFITHIYPLRSLMMTSVQMTR